MCEYELVFFLNPLISDTTLRVLLLLRSLLLRFVTRPPTQTQGGESSQTHSQLHLLLARIYFYSFFSLIVGHCLVIANHNRIKEKEIFMIFNAWLTQAQTPPITPKSDLLVEAILKVFIMSSLHHFITNSQQFLTSCQVSLDILKSSSLAKNIAVAKKSKMVHVQQLAGILLEKWTSMAKAAKQASLGKASASTSSTVSTKPEQKSPAVAEAPSFAFSLFLSSISFVLSSQN